MGLVTATRTCLRKYATFTGRARRAEFWWFYLATGLVSLVLVVPAVVLFLAAAASAPAGSSGPTAGGGAALVVGVLLYGLALLVSLALLLPIIASGVRRLHDTDRSGWWYLLTLVPLGGIVVLVLCALDGTPGPNRFGPSPKGAGAVGAPATPHDLPGRGGPGYGHPAGA